MFNPAPLQPMRSSVLFGACFAILASAGWIQACDTPVYRYAMYRWEPTPYEVYHFHRGEIGPAFAKASELLREASGKPLTPANVAVYPVDLDLDPELKTVPRDVRRMWEKRRETARLPLSMVVNPTGFEVYAGDLPEDQIPDFVNSDTRRQIGELLKKGHAGVYLLVLGKDEALNQAAEQAVARLVKDVNAGKLQLYAGPEPYDPLSPQFELPRGKEEKDAQRREAPEGNQQEATEGASEAQEAETDGEADEPADESAPHSVASLTFKQDELKSADPWLYRSLMAVENDLHEFEDEPMMFVIYGRGRALPPYIGKGIVYDNLVEITDFITSACSCTVKDQNPGVDLLMAYDWEAASAAVAERFGAEEGNEESLTDLFPQLIIPGGFGEKEGPKDDPKPVGESQDVSNPSGAETEAASVDDPETGDASASRGPSGKAPTPPVAPSADNPTAETGNEDALAHAGDQPQEVPAAQGEVAHAAATTSPNFIVPLGIGLGVAFLALLGVTFFILKPMR